MALVVKNWWPTSKDFILSWFMPSFSKNRPGSSYDDVKRTETINLFWSTLECTICIYKSKCLFYDPNYTN